MKKTIIAAIAALFGIFTVANAQENVQVSAQDTIVNVQDTLCDMQEEIVPVKPFFVTVYGGPTFSANENLGAFFEEGKAADLIDLLQGGISAGCYFSNRYGARIALEYSNNHSANNHDETHAPGLFEYKFRSGAAFADFIINGGKVDKPKKFNWRPYFGIGAAYTFGFEDIFNETAGMEHHPWQGHTSGNPCFAFRYGLMLEYDFCEAFGIYVDGTHEWFTDNYNGVDPNAGFPFDMKLNANIGIALHF